MNSKVVMGIVIILIAAGIIVWHSSLNGAMMQDDSMQKTDSMQGDSMKGDTPQKADDSMQGDTMPAGSAGDAMPGDSMAK